MPCLVFVTLPGTRLWRAGSSGRSAWGGSTTHGRQRHPPAAALRAAALRLQAASEAGDGAGQGHQEGHASSWMDAVRETLPPEVRETLAQGGGRGRERPPPQWKPPPPGLEMPDTRSASWVEWRMAAYDAEVEMQEVQQRLRRGEQVRDAKKERQFWQSAAAELITNIPADGSTVASSGTADQVPDVGASSSAAALSAEPIGSTESPTPPTAFTDPTVAERAQPMRPSGSTEVTSTPFASSSSGRRFASEWDPDTSWLQYPDLVESASAEAQQQLEEVTPEMMRDFNWETMEQEVPELEDGSTAAPVAGSAPSYPAEAPPPPPPFTSATTSPASSSTDTGAGEAERMTEELQRRGFKPRDPKADTDFWRGTARDLMSQVPTEPTASEPETSPSPPFTSATTSPASSSTDTGAGEAERMTEELQRRGFKPRDPKADTDFWRGTARELTEHLSVEQSSSTSSSSSIAADAVSTTAKGAGDFADLADEGAAHVWAAWRQSQSEYQQALETEFAAAAAAADDDTGAGGRDAGDAATTTTESSAETDAWRTWHQHRQQWQWQQQRPGQP
ncbi:hypothetical protein CDCA_CDCA05G1470 [Cyanidium caldarium]|uniref:Uncharacterized protein n=1 Tax=Cyanidium caldarium TaxID=2771 RepID=A0AAV9IT24_CYACA|nr:hypothetical protein CDCA_CDCA05G1470 [Cyanidium caldarium]